MGGRVEWLVVFCLFWGFFGKGRAGGRVEWLVVFCLFVFVLGFFLERGGREAGLDGWLFFVCFCFCGVFFGKGRARGGVGWLAVFCLFLGFFGKGRAGLDGWLFLVVCFWVFLERGGQEAGLDGWLFFVCLFLSLFAACSVYVKQFF